MGRDSRIRIIGWLAAAWMLGLFTAAMVYRAYLNVGKEPPKPQEEKSETRESRAPNPGPFELPIRFADDVALEAGLIVEYTGRSGVSAVMRTPIPAFALEAGKSPHPRIDPQEFSARWSGALRVLRRGQYRFAASLAGELRVQLGGRTVLQAVESSRARLVEGEPIELEPGTWRLDLAYRRTAPEAQLQVLWTPPDFVREPLPHRLLGVPTQVQHPAQREHEMVERGRLLVERYGCVNCHQESGQSQLKRSSGPDLAHVAERTFGEWLERWLAGPRAVRSDATMPRLFGDDETGRAERTAVVVYLQSLARPLLPEAPPADPEDYRRRGERGRRLFATIGCAACHPADANGGAVVRLPDLAAKTSIGRLADYLRHPSAHYPDARMPAMALTNDEARDLAVYLISGGKPGATKVSVVAVEKAKRQLRTTDLAASGRQLFEFKGCIACHTASGAAKPEARMARPLADLAPMEAGCLGNSSKAPQFDLPPADRAAVVAFLDSRRTAPIEHPAPGYQAERDLVRLGCLNCHRRFDAGGLTEPAMDLLRRFHGRKENELSVPPILTGAGTKLRAEWVRRVLLESARARPWMTLRMPQFGANAARLTEQLARLDGVPPSDAVHVIPYQARDVEDGRHLVSRRAFGCLKCHSIAGSRLEGGGVLGPDLADTQNRVQYEWFRRWMLEPQRLDPLTQMPANFTNLRSFVFTIHEGDALKQVDALWSYFSLGATAPLPEGNEQPDELIVRVGDRPEVIRAFLPDAGPRSIAVGFPGDVSIAFDAERCRVAYAWTGDFLDVGPSWTGRGGQVVGLLGKRFWNGPEGFDWTFGPSPGAPPDFVRLFHDPLLGAPLPEGELPPRLLRVPFLGYRLDRAGMPTFEFRWHDGSGRNVACQLSIAPRRRTAAVGFVRKWQLAPAEGQLSVGWLYAGRSREPVRRLAADGSLHEIARSAANGLAVSLPAAEAPLVVQADGRTHVLRANAGEWVVPQSDAKGAVLLRVPLAASTTVELAVWSPHRNEPAMLREILTPDVGMAPPIGQ